MKKHNLLKRMLSACGILLIALTALPLQAFAAVDTYAVYESFDGKTSVSDIGAISAHTTKSGASSGTISIISGDNSNKYLKYDKTVHNDKSIPHYTDIYFENKNSVAEEGSKYVFEVTFWYTGSLNGVSLSGEFVGARKDDGSGGMSMKALLKISDGKLYSGAGNDSNNLVTELSENTKYTVAIAVNDAEAKYNIYLNNSATAVCENVPYTSDGTTTTRIRALNLTSMTGADAASLPDFYADDFKLYYADKPVCAGGTASRIPVANDDTETNDNTGSQTPTGPSSGSTGNGSASGTIKLPTVEKHTFNFTANSNNSTSDSNAIKLEGTKDILCICGIGGASVIVIALVVVFNKKFG